MASFMQGQPLPNITTTDTKTQAVPDYYKDVLSGLSEAGTTALGKTAEQGIAGLDPLQTKGYETVEDVAGSYRPGVDAAGDTLARAASGVTGSRIQELLNPYTKNVVDEMARLQQENLERNIMPSLRAGFVGTGGSGSSRYAGALGQTIADLQANLMGQQQKSLESGYSEAMKTALGELPYLTATGRAQGELAKLEQDLGLTEASAYTKAGKEMQEYEQAKLDYPMKMATGVSQLMRGLNIPLSETLTKVGPGTSGQYGKSDFENIAGLLALTGSAVTGQGGNQAGLAVNNLLKYLGNKLPGFGFNLGIQDLIAKADAGGTLTPEELNQVYSKFGVDLGQTDTAGNRIYDEFGNLTAAGYGMIGLDEFGNPLTTD